MASCRPQPPKALQHCEGQGAGWPAIVLRVAWISPGQTQPEGQVTCLAAHSLDCSGNSTSVSTCVSHDGVTQGKHRHRPVPVLGLVTLCRC